MLAEFRSVERFAAASCAALQDPERKRALVNAQVRRLKGLVSSKQHISHPEATSVIEALTKPTAVFNAEQRSELVDVLTQKITGLHSSKAASRVCLQTHLHVYNYRLEASGQEILDTRGVDAMLARLAIYMVDGIGVRSPSEPADQDWRGGDSRRIDWM
jgi:hypothetical protein